MTENSEEKPKPGTPEFMRYIGSKGGRASAKSPKANRPFKDKEFASQQGSFKGYKFKTKRKANRGTKRSAPESA